MNIFALDRDPATCARYHVDAHVVKMILESAQMMCTVASMHGQQVPYRPTHKNHPCTVWAGQSVGNWMWLRNLCMWLNNEYRIRFGHTKNHASWEVIRDLEVPKQMPDIGRLCFVQAMPQEYRYTDSVIAYRRYYARDKKAIHKWTVREKPEWLEKFSAESFDDGDKDDYTFFEVLTNYLQ